MPTSEVTCSALVSFSFRAVSRSVAHQNHKDSSNPVEVRVEMERTNDKSAIGSNGSALALGGDIASFSP